MARTRAGVHLKEVQHYPKNPLGFSLSHATIDNSSFALRNDRAIECPICFRGIIKKKAEKWVEACPNCQAVYNFFQPTPFQDAFLRNLFAPRKRNALVGNIGAFRSGKTTIDMYAASIMATQIPGSKTLVLANSLDMLKRVATTELESFLMDEWLKVNKDGKIMKSFKNGYFFKNGSSIIFLPSDDVQKIRSITASAIIVVEADKLPYNFIEELEGRLSQYGVGTIGEYDSMGKPVYVEEITKYGGKETMTIRQKIARNFMFMICEANPDANTWVYRKWILGAQRVYTSQSAVGVERYAISKNNEIPGLTMWLSATIDNPAIGADYMDSKMKSWSQKQIRQNLYAEFVVGDSIIYPDVQNAVIKNQGDVFTWPHVFAFDPGVGKDPFAIVEVSFNPHLKRWNYVWSTQVFQKTLSEVADIIKKEANGKNVIGMVIDRSAKKTLQTVSGNVDTASGLERLLGYTLTSSVSDIDSGIKLINDMIHNETIKIYENNTDLVKNLLEYEYGEAGTDDEGYKTKLKPKNGQMDHLPDAARYAAQFIAQFDVEQLAEQYRVDPYGVGVSVYRGEEAVDNPVFEEWKARLNNRGVDPYN